MSKSQTQEHPKTAVLFKKDLYSKDLQKKNIDKSVKKL